MANVADIQGTTQEIRKVLGKIRILASTSGYWTKLVRAVLRLRKWISP